MRILKRIKYNFITIALLKTTSLIVIGAFLFTSLAWAQFDEGVLRPVAAGENTQEAQRWVRGAKVKIITRLLEELSAKPDKPRVSAREIAQILTQRGYPFSQQDVNECLKRYGLREKYSQVLIFERVVSSEPRYSRRDLLAAGPEEIPDLILTITGNGRLLTMEEQSVLRLDAQSRHAENGRDSLTDAQKAARLGFLEDPQERLARLKEIRASAWRKLSPYLKRPQLEEMGQQVIGVLTPREQEVIRWCLDPRVQWINSIKARKLSAISRQGNEEVGVSEAEVSHILYLARRKSGLVMPSELRTAFFDNGIIFSPPRAESRARDGKLTMRERISEAVFVDGAGTVTEVAKACGVSRGRVENLRRRLLRDMTHYVKTRKRSIRSAQQLSGQRARIEHIVTNYSGGAPIAVSDITDAVHPDGHTRKQYRSIEADIYGLIRSGRIPEHRLAFRKRTDRSAEEIQTQRARIKAMVETDKEGKARTTLTNLTQRISGDGYTREEWRTVRQDVRALVKTRDLSPDDVTTRDDTAEKRISSIVIYVKTHRGVTVTDIARFLYGPGFGRAQYGTAWQYVNNLIAKGRLLPSDLKITRRPARPIPIPRGQLVRVAEKSVLRPSLGHKTLSLRGLGIGTGDKLRPRATGEKITAENVELDRRKPYSAILRLLKQNGPQSINQIAVVLGHTVKTSQRYVARMAGNHARLIAYSAGQYRITEAGMRLFDEVMPILDDLGAARPGRDSAKLNKAQADILVKIAHVKESQRDMAIAASAFDRMALLDWVGFFQPIIDSNGEDAASFLGDIKKASMEWASAHDGEWPTISEASRHTVGFSQKANTSQLMRSKLWRFIRQKIRQREMSTTSQTLGTAFDALLICLEIKKGTAGRAFGTSGQRSYNMAIMRKIRTIANRLNRQGKGKTLLITVAEQIPEFTAPFKPPFTVKQRKIIIGRFHEFCKRFIARDRAAREEDISSVALKQAYESMLEELGIARWVGNGAAPVITDAISMRRLEDGYDFLSRGKYREARLEFEAAKRLAEGRGGGYIEAEYRYISAQVDHGLKACAIQNGSEKQLERAI